MTLFGGRLLAEASGPLGMPGGGGGAPGMGGGGGAPLMGIGGGGGGGGRGPLIAEETDESR